MEKEGEDFFWAADMLIVSDLSKVTIYNVIQRIIDTNDISRVFSEIGIVSDVYANYREFDSIPNNWLSNNSVIKGGE